MAMLAEAIGTNPDAGSASTVQTYARIAGLLALVSVFAGGFGEAYVPTLVVVPNDAAATAGNLVQNSLLVRLGFASYLVEALCDVGLAAILYALLRPVQRDLALLATFFRLIGTGQLDSLALQSINLGQYGAIIFMMFYGTGFLLTGWVMLRASYLPKFLGVLMLITGAGFMSRTFLWVLAPAYASPFLLLPAVFAGLGLGLWLSLKGVDAGKWREQVQGVGKESQASPVS